MLVHSLSLWRMEYEGTPFSPYLRATFHFFYVLGYVYDWSSADVGV